ncbi:MAG: response regulator transcription factor [Proteobacteria bacterium]|nr:response regulator transcription factor [Pseudomonadota bacterium]
MDQSHILVVDDDDRLRDLLTKYLSESGFRVSSAESAADARRKMAGIAFDLLVLDVMMPGETGLEFAQSLRHRHRGAVPILMLTAMSEVDDRIRGLEQGADDYLVKPFEPRELVLRINNILRRVPAESVVPKKARLGAYEFDLDREELWCEGKRIRLTSAETNLLKALASNPGAILSREELANHSSPGGGERTVDVQVTRLRAKIEPDPKLPKYLQTVRGQGYVFRPD